VELYLSEERIATLYQRPYVQSVLLPGGDLVYIRAVAFLEDGSSTEDVVFVNAPAYLEEVEVQYVELHALVLDGGGRPILGLEEDSFTIKEDGREQTIKRFEWVKDLPIHAGLLIDTSASMEDSLETVRSAALRFAESAIEEKDRICLLSFSSQPHVEVRFTNEVSQIERALLGLRPEGSTALYDSLVYALTYFDGVKGQKVLLLLSDGKDENSAFDFEATLEVARRSGVIVYAIGLKDASREKSARKTLQKLADQTGGRAYFVDDLSELEAIYAAIEEELRSRYLLAYQSTSTKDPSEFRSIGVDVDRRDVEVRTLAGYYP
jgi:VWFA-related protein